LFSSKQGEKENEHHRNKKSGKVEVHYDKSIPRGYLIQGINQGVSDLSLPVSLIGIDTLLTPYLTGINPYDNKEIKPIVLSVIDDKPLKELEENKKKGYVSGKIDTLKIDTLNLQEHTPIKKCSKQDVIGFINSKQEASTDDVVLHYGKQFRMAIESKLENMRRRLRRVCWKNRAL